jgi:hypothetical protein
MMKVAATLILAVMLSLAQLPGQHASSAGRLTIEVRNLTERHSYGLKDSVVLDFEIINSGSQPVGVFAKLGMGYQGGFILHVLNDMGAEIEPPTLAHDFLDFDAMQNARNYFELPPHQFFGTRQEFAVAELVGKPGLYKLLAEYRCPVDARYGKVGNFWSVERKSVVSGEIEFNVK